MSTCLSRASSRSVQSIRYSAPSINRSINQSMTQPMSTLPIDRSLNESMTQPMSGLPSRHNPHLSKQDPLLFTPGPLTTSFTVKQAMVRDMGSRDAAFLKIIREVRSGLLEVANVSEKEFTTVIMQGSGTFGVESVISSVVPKPSKQSTNQTNNGILVIANGAYGERIGKMAQLHGLNNHLISCSDNEMPSMDAIQKALESECKSFSHVAVVHSETTSGIINDIELIGKLVKKYNKSFIVDAMSSFGAVPIDFEAASIDYLVSSANKCIEGVPGFAFAIARKSAVAQVDPSTPSTLSLNMLTQLAGLDKDGQFRFTPPTQALLAFHQALLELKQEGGVTKRMQRYQTNQRVLMAGMKPLGFELYLPSELQGWIISGYRYLEDPNWNFATFYQKLNDRGFIIYPGKVSKADCFRIGHIGRLFEQDTQQLVQTIDEVCKEMKTGKYYVK